MQIKYFSMFSGIGGFELAIHNVFGTPDAGDDNPTSDMSDNPGNLLQKGRFGATCVGYSEIDKYAIKVYERQFNGHKNYGDATRIDPKQLPDFDLLVGGFPCQAFSVAGKRHGFNDTRGTLFFDIARILDHKRPRYFILENVKGLLNHEGGQTIQKIFGVLAELGYSVQWQILNSKDFGVPQNRERIIIVGHLGTEPRPEIFPITQTSEAPSSFGEEAREKIATTLKAKVGGPDVDQTYVIDRKAASSETRRGMIKKGVTGTLDRDQQQFVAIPVLTPDRLVKRQNGRRFKTNGEPSFTLNTQDRHGVLLEDMQIRRLTPLECERLQGFPDGWTMMGAELITNTRGLLEKRPHTISDTQRYKMCGNAVTVNVIQAVAERLYESIT